MIHSRLLLACCECYGCWVFPSEVWLWSATVCGLLEHIGARVHREQSVMESRVLLERRRKWTSLECAIFTGQVRPTRDLRSVKEYKIHGSLLTWRKLIVLTRWKSSKVVNETNALDMFVSTVYVLFNKHNAFIKVKQVFHKIWMNL